MPWVLAIVSIGLGVYSAVASAEARSKQEDALKAHLANEGILTAAEKKLKEAQINAIESAISSQPQPAASPQMASTPGTSTATTGPPLDTALKLGAAGLLLYIGLKAVKT